MSLLLGALCACQLTIAAADSTPLDATRLVERARSARYQQDSVLANYRTLARQRWSFGIGLGAAEGLGARGRTRLAARFESVARMYWDHERGAFGELLAGRGVVPVFEGAEPTEATADIIFVIPFVPGRESLWPLGEMREALPGNPTWITHPLEVGSDSLYRFRLGGPVTITLPSARRVELRELVVTPRRPDARLIVGSLWVDVASGALVRAAYRPSVAVDLLPYMLSRIPKEEAPPLKALGPFRGHVEEVVIEHGLYAERFWLPRARLVHAEGTAKVGRVSISIEQSFDYEEVRALPASVIAAARDTTTIPRRVGDEFAVPARYTDEFAVVVENGVRVHRQRTCRAVVPGDSGYTPLSLDSISATPNLAVRRIGSTGVRILFPCDRTRLPNSPELPKSIFAPSEALFTEADFGRLESQVLGALTMGKQADWAPQPVQWSYGARDGMLRFNRVEGLSAGLLANRELGAGIAVRASARLGLADRIPNAELAVRRGAGAHLVGAGVFRRLAASNDWGNSLGLGASMGTLLFGNDYGLYFRTAGAELHGVRSRVASGATLTWRVFIEQQRDAATTHGFAVAHWFNGGDFAPNIVAEDATFTGASARWNWSLGARPQGTQLSGEVALEAAERISGSEGSYARGRGELRLTQGIGRIARLSLIGASGITSGAVPVQRQFFLGGPWTVHAYGAGALAGPSFWFSRAELSTGMGLIRPTLFYDLGWAGERQSFARSADRRAAAGAGIALLDGLIRLDAAARTEGRPRWSLDLYVDVR